jgi:hypothetical protein
MAAAAPWEVDQARENPAGKWIKLVRISPPQVDQARENDWIMLVRNDTVTLQATQFSEEPVV